MAATKKPTKKRKAADTSELSRDDVRALFTMAIATKKEEAAAVLNDRLGSRQLPDELDYKQLFEQNKGLLPYPYNPVKMHRIVEESSILPQCVDAMGKNIDGFGHALAYKGETGQENSAEALKERNDFEEMLKRINEKESFVTVRKNMRLDLEITGNGYFEVIRDRAKTPSLIYHADARFMFAQRIQEEPQEIKARLFRRGDYRTLTVMRRFRRYAMVTDPQKTKIKWFKEFGDPREMCAITGKYEPELKKGKKIQESASEIYHFKLGNGVYGIPRWVGTVLTVMGMRSSDFVNWDLFENQVVPPLAVLVSGGKLTAESVMDIQRIFLEKKGLENFNKILLLEAQSDGSISDKSRTQIELKELSSARKEDAMFTQYIDKGEHRVRGAFRLPPLYLGRADTYSKSTADSSKMVAEEQVFVPERLLFDEIANNELFQPFNLKFWEFKSKGPRLVSGVDVTKGFEAFNKGAIFSINDGIRLANKLLGTDIAVYNEDWANFPIPIVLEEAKRGTIELPFVQSAGAPPIEPNDGGTGNAGGEE